VSFDRDVTVKSSPDALSLSGSFIQQTRYKKRRRTS